MKKIIKLLGGLVILYVFGMTLTYMIPNKSINENVADSMEALNSEKEYPPVNLFDEKATRLDNFTDKIMIDKARGTKESSLTEGMFVNGYPRYWHGYQIFLRPLLIVFNYSVIRQIYGLILVLLIGINFYLYLKKLDVFIAFSFLLSLYFVRIYIFFLSMQFSNVFFVMLLFNIFLLKNSKKNISNKQYFLYFLTIGSLTNFFDLLTVPLVTLGIPLITLIYLNLKKASISSEISVDYLKSILLNSFSWGIGYGLTWLSKWIFASLVLKKNILEDAFRTIIFRTEGDNNIPLNRINMFENNMNTMFNNFYVVLIACVIILTIIILIKKREHIMNRISLNSIYILLLIGYPYIWYTVLAGHSQVHYWFTYRLQIIAVFSLLSFLSYIISSLFNSKNEEMKI
ncbi:hypothetical protein G15_1159 [Enterococcus avium]|uniref:hypothetical protein n=2 Tax=Enterococcus TaxID=1350 RepID=UPI001599F56A|nr:hypothetical protein [Enterococcus malodoratus]BBM17514.1 hypothetical protein G15_1159 [Enterococcus avium]